MAIDGTHLEGIYMHWTVRLALVASLVLVALTMAGCAIGPFPGPIDYL